MTNQNIGDFLFKLRKEKGLTQGELALKFNVTHQSVSKWEKGDSIPDIHILRDIAVFYEVTIEEILSGERRDIKMPLKNDKLLSLLNLEIVYVAFLIGIFIFLAFFYFHEQVSLNADDMFGGFGSLGPIIGNEYIVFSARGYNLIFNATKITLYTGAMWLIFISLIVLLIFKTMNIYSIKKFDKLHSTVNLKVKFNVIRMLEILVVASYISMAIAMVFESSISMGIGFFIGIVFVALICVLNRIKSKQTELA